jgi:hypothetical protein
MGNYNKELEVYTFTDRPDFMPSYSPIQMVNEGVFGGNYFGNSEVEKNWTDCVPTEFLNECKDVAKEKLLQPTYMTGLNKYGVGCGMDYQGWIDSGWIIEQDPYGWFNWYINFFYGRRSADDDRQIGRWKSFIARHSGMLKSRCKKLNKSIKDETIGLKTRQGLLHWAYKL